MVDMPNGENTSFSQAKKAYYKDQNYEEAIKEFQAAIEYERSKPPDTLDSEVIVRSLHMMGMAYQKEENQRNQAIETFKQLASCFSQHALGRAAKQILEAMDKPEEQQRQRQEQARREKERQLEIERQEQVRRTGREKEKQTLLKSLRECFEQDFLNADEDFKKATSFYRTQCTAHISPEEYETEKTNYLKRVKQERRAEEERREQARREKEKQALLKSLRECFEQDFLNADKDFKTATSFYRTRCKAHISNQEYQIERTKYFKRLKQEQRVAAERILRECFEQDFLSADEFYQAICIDHISREEYETEKINYVQSWAEGRLDPKPDCEQAAAIGAVEGHVQVVARAGSGKTATLVSRALFLQQHCGVSPDEMLLLAFNRKAEEEMRDRLTSYLKSSIPHVRTFHALAHALVQPDGKILEDPDIEAILQDMINRYRRDYRHPNHYDQIRALMIAHFRDDLERAVCTPEEILRYRRSLLRESLAREHVKSFGEKVIANFLFEHNIEYIYEKKFRWDDGNYRPDFTIDRHRVVIEYFGLAGKSNYDAEAERKRSYWRSKPNWRLLEFFRQDLTSNGMEGFYTLLQQRLADCGITCNQLSEDEIWNRIKHLRPINQFTKATVGFIKRCRKLSLTPDQLSEKVNNHDCASDVEQDFLSLAQVFYKSYLEYLESTGDDDFDGLMQKAAAQVTRGETEFKYKSGTRTGNLKQIRYVLIDEYQDFSELFHRLMEAVREQNPNVRFFCVGDDWQAINGFAGSELRFFQNFEQFFEGSCELHVATNYRSAPAIVDVSNALMEGQGSGKRARAHHQKMRGKVAIADLGTFEPTPQEKKENPGDNFTPAVLRLVNNAINDGKNVVLLSRNNSLLRPGRDDLDYFLKFLHSGLSNEIAKKLTKSTVHSYKGLDQDVVIVLDAVPRCYPLIHPNLIFTRIFSDSVETVVDEERRLFYVALTRAVKDLFILTETDNFSPFLEDLERNIELPRLEWLDYPPAQYIAIRVSNQDGRGPEPTTAIREALRMEGYRWYFESKFWYSIRPAEGFSVSEFADRAKWSKSADGIEVRFYGHLENQVARYHVDGGKWKCISGNIDNIPELPHDDIPF